ncbi:MAG: hypothetical protein JWQ96_843 [Segetibacter sp.]|jgi:hypothetical protein|nr:hypothetical protein [Segetibacter sp.]
MEVFDYRVENKGAAVGPKTQGGEHAFTYLVADDKAFHCYCDEHENWINHRDNGKSIQVDQDVINKLRLASQFSA